VGFSYVISGPIIFNACMVIMLTAVIAPSLCLTTQSYLAGYVGVTLVGALLATAVGFTVIPGVSRPSRERALKHAIDETVTLLEAVATATPTSLRACATQLGRAIRAQQNTVPTAQTRLAGMPTATVLEASSALRNINLVCLAALLGLAGPANTLNGALAAAARALKAAREGAPDPATAEALSGTDATDLFTGILLVETEHLQTALTAEPIIQATSRQGISGAAG
jgi:uncharacterized membrane protein YccC